MTTRSAFVRLIISALVLAIGSFAACQEGQAHDQSGSCVIDLSMPPPFLGFEYWTPVGVAMGVLACGVIFGALLVVRNE